MKSVKNKSNIFISILVVVNLMLLLWVFYYDDSNVFIHAGVLLSLIMCWDAYRSRNLVKEFKIINIGRISIKYARVGPLEFAIIAILLLPEVLTEFNYKSVYFILYFLSSFIYAVIKIE